MNWWECPGDGSVDTRAEAKLQTSSQAVALLQKQNIHGTFNPLPHFHKSFTPCVSGNAKLSWNVLRVHDQRSDLPSSCSQLANNFILVLLYLSQGCSHTTQIMPRLLKISVYCVEQPLFKGSVYCIEQTATIQGRWLNMEVQYCICITCLAYVLVPTTKHYV